VSDVAGLRDALKKRLPHAARKLDDSSLIVSVNGAMVLSNEDATPIRSGDEVAVLRIIAGG
jgi:sulfur carrier protein ThiS